MLLQNLISHFDSLWPPASKEEWDKPGLMLGNPSQEVTKVLLSVDVTKEVIEEAVATGCQLLVSHHPMFMRGVFELSEQSVKGANSALAIRGGLAVFSAHTNADFQVGGVTQSLAQKLGLSELKGLETTNSHVVIGSTDPLTLLDFARLVAKRLPPVAQGVRVSGDPAKLISKVAVLAGAGDSYLPMVGVSDADVYITSDLRHHPAQDFAQASQASNGPALIDISHWAAEWIWLDNAKAQLERLIPGVEFVVSEINTDPWTFAVMQ